MLSPKEKAKELVDAMYNTKHCGIKHIPNKHYCDCSEINFYQAKQCALVVVDEIMKAVGWKKMKLGVDRDNYWQEVKEEIKKLC